jgi:hypothetical protein
MLMSTVAGIEIPSAGPVFAVALGVHIVGGVWSVVTGAAAATARKRPGRHPRAGLLYLWGIGLMFATAAVMSTIRWRQDAHLFAIAIVAAGLAAIGWFFRPTRRPARFTWHAIGMGGSYIALLAGFYVDNGPQLPLWRLLPHWTYWALPIVIGGPLVLLALRRFRSGVSARPRGTVRSDEPARSQEQPEWRSDPQRRAQSR